MIYDFDHGPDRRGTSCLKYDFALERGKPADVLPLWVADMDFPPRAGAGEKSAHMADTASWLQRHQPAMTRGVRLVPRRFAGTPARMVVKTPGVVFARPWPSRPDEPATRW